MNPRPFSILIVSPDRLTLRRLSRFLDVFGYEVRQATDAAQALAASESKLPDFLIVDGTSGQPADLQICRAVRRVWPQGYTYALLLSERPEVADVTAALEQGFDDFLAAPIVFGELLARIRAGARVIEFERRLSEQATADPVTGLAVKAALGAELVRRSQGANGFIGWLAVFDMDYFQRFADRLGRQAAQNLLRLVVDHVRSRCSEGHFCASLAEDRLAIVLPASGAEAARTWCEELLRSVAESVFTVAELPNQVTASCGLTEITAAEALDAIQTRVLRALAIAKSSGRNCVVTTSEVDRDADDWAAYAAGGKLFHTTVARDVMQPCPLLLHLDESLDHAQALLSLTGLAHAPVIDAEGKLMGLVSLDQLASARLRHPKPRNAGGTSSSVRLVRHAMSTDITRFDESTPLAELMEFFTVESATPLAVIVRNKRPRGVVHCQALAALNERLTADHFVGAKPCLGGSGDLVVPELAIAE